MDRQEYIPVNFDEYQKKGDVGFEDLDAAFSVDDQSDDQRQSDQKTASNKTDFSADDNVLKEEEPIKKSSASKKTKDKEKKDLKKNSNPQKTISNIKLLNKKWMIGAIAAVVLVVGYLGGSVFYNNHFYNNASFNGVKVGNMTANDVVDTFKEEAEYYSLAVKKWDDQTVQINGSDIRCAYEDKGVIQKVMDAQSGWEWPAHLFGETPYTGETKLTFDEAKLKEKIDAITASDGSETVKPENAHPVYEEGKIVIKPEIYGNTVNVDKTAETIKAAVSSGIDQLDMKTSGCYETPQYKSGDDAVKKAKEAMEKCLKASITYVIDDEKETLASVTFGPWLKVDGEMNVLVDDESAAGYLSSLGKKYDIAGGPYTFTTTGGSVLSINNGTYGWAINEAAELPLLKESILAGETVSRAPVSSGPERRTGSTVITGTYVEISISSQTMWLYVDGNCLVSTPVVTGNVALGRGTPTGVFAIMYHDANTHLTGRDYDGSEYDSPVRYWMPFVGDIGIHDADWRSVFGGTIYLTDGSHGCVNTPIDAAGIIYNNTSDGCPVVVY